MKRTLTIALCVIMLLAFAAPAMADGIPAIPTNDTIQLDGVTIAAAAYKINDNNYFKLRDLAKALNGTKYQFDVNYDDAAKTVSITTGKAYTAVGGELAGTAETPKAVVDSAWKVSVDGKQVDAKAYNVDGNNYFKLRDVGTAIGFGVGYNSYSHTAFMVADLAAGPNIVKDPASATGYNAVFVLDDHGYEKVQITGSFNFAPVLTEDCDYDHDWDPIADENGMAVKDEKGKSAVVLGRDVSAEKDNIKANTLEINDNRLPLVVDAYHWSKSYVYDDPTTEAKENVQTSLDHWSSNTTYDMVKADNRWVISIPLPSGQYSYSFSVTKDGKTTTINDPVNQEENWTKVIPAENAPGFENTNQGYRQAYCTLELAYNSNAYVPFDKEKQVWDWSYLLPVTEGKQYEGEWLVDVPYPQRDDIVVAEVAQAQKDGLDDSNGLVDFLRKNEEGDSEGLLCIYLPKGYDANRATPYKVVYRAHGGRGSQEVDTKVSRIADNVMASEGWNHDNDFIIVTFNCYASATDKAWPSWFDWKVLANITENIIPYMEENYNVGTKEADRALCGFSGGAAVSHYGLLYYSDWFDYFGIFSTGEACTVPGEANGYLKYVQTFEQFLNAGLQDEHVLVGVGSYDTSLAGGYTVWGTKDAVQTVRYDHLYRSFVGLRDIIKITDMEWLNAHGAHDGVSQGMDFYKFFSEYLWK